jgi:hypothetical protein
MPSGQIPQADRVATRIGGACLATHPEVLIRVREDQVFRILDGHQDRRWSPALGHDVRGPGLDLFDHGRRRRLELLHSDLRHAMSLPLVTTQVVTIDRACRMTLTWAEGTSMERWAYPGLIGPLTGGTAEGPAVTHGWHTSARSSDP